MRFENFQCCCHHYSDFKLLTALFYYPDMTQHSFQNETYQLFKEHSIQRFNIKHKDSVSPVYNYAVILNHLSYSQLARHAYFQSSFLLCRQREREVAKWIKCD